MCSQDELETLLILNSCLAQRSRLTDGIEDDEYTTKLSLWISESILPNGTLIPHDSGESLRVGPTCLRPGANALADSPPTPYPRPVLIARHKGILGLNALQILNAPDESPRRNPTLPKVLLAIVAFTSTRDPWTTFLTSQYAYVLLDTFKTQSLNDEFLIKFVLSDFIRPLFSKSRPETVTVSGRRAMPSSAPLRPHNFKEAEMAMKPWRYDYPYSITVFEWAVNNVSVSHPSPSPVLTDSPQKKTFNNNSNWSLFIPPLVTLLDTSQTYTLVRALQIFTSFIPNCPPKLLSQTGLDSVFTDTLLPKLLSMPTLTPLADSLSILPSVYTALFALSHARYPILNSAETKDINHPFRIAFLDRVLRNGIITGYIHCSEQHSLVIILIAQIARFCEEMGIHIVKHLSSLLPILTQALCDPFNIMRPKDLLTTVKTTQSVILAAWPRLSDRSTRNEIVRGLVGTWEMVVDDRGRRLGETCFGGLKVFEGKKEEEERERQRSVHMRGPTDYEVLEKVREEVIKAGKLVASAVKGRVDMQVELRVLIRADENLAELFGIDVETEEKDIVPKEEATLSKETDVV